MLSQILTLIIGGLMLGSIYGLVGMGYGLIYKASGLMTLAQGDMLMIGSFLGMTFYKLIGLPFVISILLVMLIMFLLGMAIQRFMVTPLLARGAKEVSIILCTVAISIILQNGAMFMWGSNTMNFPSIFGVDTITFFGITMQPERLLALGVGVVCMIGLHFFMQKSKFGTSMRAAAQDPVAATALGINVPVTKGVAWGIASMLAGGIGVVVGPIYGVYTAMGVLIGQKAFASAVVGGYGNMYGSILGGLFFGFVETFVAAVPSVCNYKDLISFGILIIVMVVLPNGITNEQVME